MQNRKLAAALLRLAAALAILPLVPSAAQDAPAAPAPFLAVVPLPAHIVPSAGAFSASVATRVEFDSSDQGVKFAANIIYGALRQLCATCAPPLAKDSAPHIVVRRLADPDATGKEGYRIEVTPVGIVVSASQSAGLYYGAITLEQLIAQSPAGSGAVAIPAMTIDDSPRFAWRGLLLDSVRHFQSVATIKHLIDLMSRDKLNVLQWHLTDDQGWRLQIKAYPRLTSVGAWRVPAGEAARHDIDPKTHKPRLYGGFYTQAEVRDVVAYAAQRNVTIVPEIEMPGHALAAIVAYPWLGSVSHPPQQVSSDWGVFSYLYNPGDNTFKFLEAVLGETMALFPSTYIHVGGDEAVKDQWRASSAVQARMRALGMKDEDALQSWFVARIGRYLKAHGRRLIGWDEILQGGVPPDATITSWRGIDGAIVAAKSGHDAVLSPAPVLYFDNRPAEGRGWPSGRGAIVTLEQVYGFDPASTALNDDQRRHIIGVQANIWTEHIREEGNIFYAAFPRATAVAEIAWSPAAPHDFAEFSARLAASRLPSWDALPDRKPGYADPGLISSAYRDSHDLKLCGGAIVLSIEGPAPLAGPRPVFLHDIMNPCWIEEKVDMTGLRALRTWAGQLPFNFQIGADAAKVALRPQTTPDGEFVVHLDSCDGPKIATVPMPHSKPNAGLVEVEGPIAPQTGTHDLCFVFTRAKLEPYWALYGIDLSPPSEKPPGE